MSYTLKLSQDHDDRRLDRTIRSLWKWVTLGEIMKSIRKGEVRVNGVRVRDGGVHVHTGDELCVPWPLKDDGRLERIVPASWGRIKVIYQGHNVLILNKPADILVQPDEPNGDSVISRVWKMLGTTQPAAVHRLDRNTTGVLAIALHGDALRALEALFRARRVRKFYLAICVGIVPKEITIDAPLLKDSDNNKVSVSEDGQPAKTLCTCLAHDNKFSLVKLELLTGRTHQARVHMAHIKHPILGDRKYGDFRVNRSMKNINRPMLHAYELAFPDDVVADITLSPAMNETLPPTPSLKEGRGERKSPLFKGGFKGVMNTTRGVTIHDSLREVAGHTFRAEIPDDMRIFIETRRLNYEE